MSMISAQGVAVALAGKTVLSGIDFTLDRGEIVTIVGPNGSGKSTLLRLLIGALAPRSGRLSRKAALRIGYVPQKLAIDPTLPLSVLRFLGLPRRVGAPAARAALAETGVAGLETRQMAELSGGQFQRVLLARALLNRPEVLVLDEPTQGLDQPAIAAFYRLIEGLRDRLGCAVLMVSHDLHVVMSASDRVICLNGHICCEGTPNVVRAAPEYRALFGQGTDGALALYQHEHDHHHDHAHHAHAHHDHGQSSLADPGHAGQGDAAKGPAVQGHAGHEHAGHDHAGPQRS